MKILVINAGSSTLKFQLLNTENQEVLAKGNVERIGEGAAFLSYKANGQSYKIEENVDNHTQAMELVIKTLLSEDKGVLKSLSDVDAFGHRMVNAGEDHFDPTLVTPEILKLFKEKIYFAPLHMPGGIAGVEACMQIAPEIKNVAVFDVGFHKNIPDYAYRYAIDNRYYTEYGIRRYGAHGTSHYFVSRECAKIMNKPMEDIKIVTCHMGGGASISAVKGGHSIDTSMGFTPLEGVMMNTRSGDLDPSIVEFLCEKENMTVSQVISKLNKQSGLFAINNGVADMRELTSPENINTPSVQLALNMYAYRVKKYIGSYIAAMNGADAIVFTAGIGEHTPELRQLICENMEYLGIEFDNEKNFSAKRGEISEISKEGSKVKVFIIPTNEELVIAEETEKIVRNI